MRLIVSHVTRYTFDAPVRRAVQSHRLTPTRAEGQKTLRWQVTVEGAERGACFRDGAGDWVETVSLRGPLEAIEVRVSGEVETADTAGVLRGHREKVPPLAYLRRSRQAWPTPPIKALSREALAGMAGAPALDRAHALSAAAAEAVAYRPGETEAHTTAAEALELGVGVCQDQAHLLIAMAREQGLPARYVSGYLHATQDGEVHEAAHAWAEIHVPDLGWVGFDVANRCCPDARYVRLGSGYEATDAAPIRGVVEGASEERLEVTVSVEEAAQQ